MGESVTEGTVSKWLKQVGEPGREGGGLVGGTTDKVDAEIPAPGNGTLSKILADAGKTIAVGAPLAEIQIGADGGAQKREQGQAAPHPGPTPQGEGNRNLAAAPAEAEAKVAKKAAPNVSEGAELLARARGIDLAAVTGTGPEGLIRRRDVLNAIEEKERTSAPRAEKSGAPTPPSSGSAPPLQAQVTTGSIPLRGAAGALAKHMEESLQVPTATSFRTLRVDVLDQRRRQLNQAIQADGRPEKVSYTHVIAFAIVRAARDEPSMAVTFDRVDGVPTRVARGLRQLGVTKVMTMTSTYDHRVIQGAESGEFLRRIEELLGGADGFYESIFESMRVAVPVTPATETARPLAVSGESSTPPTVEAENLRAVAAGMALVAAYRSHGHLAARLDPLGSAPPGDPSLDPFNHGLTPALMESVPAGVLRVRVPGENLAEVLLHLRETYCSTIAYEIEHISSHEQRNWLREKIESGRYRQPLSPERKLQLLGRLTKVEAMDRYLRRAFLGQKTFSIEGLDSMIVMLEEALQLLAEDGTRQVVMGMAHRGRLGVIAHVVNRPYESILVEFEAAKERGGPGGDTTGDVKYHAEAEGTYVTPTGKQVSVSLLANPSHLEAVDPVVEGWTRAEQTRRKGPAPHFDRTGTVPILIHGDAAFPAQGVVAEVLNLSKLEGYATGGTLHIIANNHL